MQNQKSHRIEYLIETTKEFFTKGNTNLFINARMICVLKKICTSFRTKKMKHVIANYTTDHKT